MAGSAVRPVHILGLIGRSDSSDCHDAAAAIVRDGQVLIALEQERVSRRRHATGESAMAAAERCLADASLKLDDLDHVAYGWLESLDHPEATQHPEIIASSELNRVILPPRLLADNAAPKIHFVRHHLAHMAASFYASGFDQAAGVILDGQGENESISLYHGRGSSLTRLRSYPIECSLGMFYEAAAFYAGLGWDAAGKLMGLASFGSPSVRIDLAFDPDSGEIRLPAPIRKKFRGSAASAHSMAQLWLDYFSCHCYPFSRGTPESVMYYQDFAASVQCKLEEIAYGLAAYAKRLTGSRLLVLAGGVALNCGVNQKIADSNLYDDIYIFPAANDSGASVGAALALYHQLRDDQPSHTVLLQARRADLGLRFGKKSIMAALAATDLKAEALSRRKLVDRAAGVLARGGLLCWFSGRDEFGPRALGQRSLLADPRRRTNLAKLNRIKGREPWRPIAPSVQIEHASTVFDEAINPALGRFMLAVARVSPSYRKRAPAVAHVDGTARPHLVDRADQLLFWRLLENFRVRTGMPLVCNTSLNIRGEPLVHTPDHAIELFQNRPEIEALILDPFYVERPANFRPEFDALAPVASKGPSL